MQQEQPTISTASEPDSGGLPGSSTPTPVAQRYHHLDAVRAFALLLGVFFHAAESFGPNNHYWAIVDSSPTMVMEAVRFACHSFRLELFFLIAGFFARYLLVRRGTPAFFRNRVHRILVPLVVGWVLLYPVLVLTWIWGASVSGRLAQFGVPPEALHLPVWQLGLGFFLTGGFIQKFDLTHLWFLHQLFVLYLLILGFRGIVVRFDWFGRTMSRVDAAFGWVCARPIGFYGLLFPTVPILLLMDSWGVDTPKESLLPHVPTTLLFGYFFVVGWLWQRQPFLMDWVGRRWAWYLAAGVATWIVLLGSFEAFWLPRLPFTFLYAQMMWGLVLGFLGLFARFVRAESRWWRYVADASYWIYIVHLPLVVALQVFVGRMELPWPVKYLGICVVTFSLVFLSYHYLVRSTFISAHLNGHRYPRQWPWTTDS